MREIKFRAKIKGDAGVYPVWDISFWNQQALIGRHSGEEWLPFKKIQAFLQYTGLKDSKGHEIWEGDILRHGWGIKKLEYETIEVSWSEDHCQWYAGIVPITQLRGLRASPQFEKSFIEVKGVIK